MIDNVVLLITGTLHERDTHELLERCHPLGVFDTMPALCVATNIEELYQSVLVETPLGEQRHLNIINITLPSAQHHTSGTVYLRQIWMTSTLKLSATRYTRRTWRISTTTAPRWGTRLQR